MDKSGEFRLARILRLAGILLLARGHVKKNPGPINVRLSYQLLHLEKVRPGASTIVSVAHEMFALVSLYCRAGVHPSKAKYLYLQDLPKFVSQFCSRGN